MGKIAFMLYKDADDELPLTNAWRCLVDMAGLFVILVLLYAAYAFFFANKILDEVLLSSLSLLAAVLPQGLWHGSDYSWAWSLSLSKEKCVSRSA